MIRELITNLGNCLPGVESLIKCFQTQEEDRQFGFKDW